MSKEIKEQPACPNCIRLEKLLLITSANLDNAYKVKDLSWDQRKGESTIHVASCMFGVFFIYPTERNDYHFELYDSNFSGNCDELEEAQRRCNMHFQKLFEPYLRAATLIDR